MTVTELNLPREDVRKLLAASSGDAAMLYMYIRCGNDPCEAETALGMNGVRFGCASATLRQLGLWPTEKQTMIHCGERPNYSERDVTEAVESDGTFRSLYGEVQRVLGKTVESDGTFRSLYGEVQRVLGKTLNTEELKILLGFTRYLGLPPDVISVLVNYCNTFRSLYGEVQRVLGKTLNTEELKILLGFTRYLGLPPDVISVLVNYCKDRLRQRGSNRNPSLRTIEKEAYAWAERGIDTMEEAAAFIQNQNVYNSSMAHIKHLVQIRGRRLTAAEERYAQSWAQMGFDDAAITMAYERTCINTGGLKWPYMNSILKRWHEAGLHTAEQIEAGDRGKAPVKQERRELDEDELAAIARMMREE